MLHWMLMTETSGTPETVQVSIETIRSIIINGLSESTVSELLDSLPVSKPHFVAVDLDKVHGMTGYEIVTSLRGTPDMFDLIDDTIERSLIDIPLAYIKGVQKDIRTAFGVS